MLCRHNTKGAKETTLTFAKIADGVNQREFTISKADATIKWFNTLSWENVQTFVQSGFGDLNNVKITILVKWIHDFSRPIKANRTWAERENNKDLASKDLRDPGLYLKRKWAISVPNSPKLWSPAWLSSPNRKNGSFD